MVVDSLSIISKDTVFLNDSLVVLVDSHFLNEVKTILANNGIDWMAWLTLILPVITLFVGLLGSRYEEKRKKRIGLEQYRSAWIEEVRMLKDDLLPKQTINLQNFKKQLSNLKDFKSLVLSFNYSLKGEHYLEFNLQSFYESLSFIELKRKSNTYKISRSLQNEFLLIREHFLSFDKKYNYFQNELIKNGECFNLASSNFSRLYGDMTIFLRTPEVDKNQIKIYSELTKEINNFNSYPDSEKADVVLNRERYYKKMLLIMQDAGLNELIAPMITELILMIEAIDRIETDSKRLLKSVDFALEGYSKSHIGLSEVLAHFE